MNVANSVLWRMEIILNANIVNLFLSSFFCFLVPFTEIFDRTLYIPLAHADNRRKWTFSRPWTVQNKKNKKTSDRRINVSHTAASPCNLCCHGQAINIACLSAYYSLLVSSRQNACAVLYYHLQPACLYHVFTHYLTNSTTNEKKLLNIKSVYLFYL
jgi:hypothetical protein